MSDQQRVKHLSKVASAPVSVSAMPHTCIQPTDTPSVTNKSKVPQGPTPSNSVANSSNDKSDKRELPVDVNSFAQHTSIPLPCLKGIWSKAETLLNSPTAMSSAPGCSKQSRMVKSYGGKRPHMVVPGKGGSYKCDDGCANFKSLSICAHTVVVAELNGSLTDYVEALKKSKKSLTIRSSHYTNFLGVWVEREELFLEKGM